MADKSDSVKAPRGSIFGPPAFTSYPYLMVWIGLAIIVPVWAIPGDQLVPGVLGGVLFGHGAGLLGVDWWSRTHGR